MEHKEQLTTDTHGPGNKDSHSDICEGKKKNREKATTVEVMYQETDQGRDTKAKRQRLIKEVKGP